MAQKGRQVIKVKECGAILGLEGQSGQNRLGTCSAQTRTGMGHLRKPPGVELIPAVD